jgi:DNA-binding protein YbaB
MTDATDDAGHLGDDEVDDGDAGGLAGAAGAAGFDVGSLLDNFQKMQEAQAASFEGQSGGGAVRIRATGAMEFEAVTIARDAVDPEDVEMLQDLVLAALHDLADQILTAQRGALGPLGSLDLGGLFGGPA